MGPRDLVLYLLSGLSVAILLTLYVSNQSSESSLSSERVWPALEFNWRIVLATLIAFVGSAFRTVSGGHIFVPMLTLIIGFDTKSADALSECLIWAASASSVYYNVRVQHPILDYDLALLFQPIILLFGSITLGALSSVVFPCWLIIVVIIILFIALLVSATAECSSSTSISEDGALSRPSHRGTPHRGAIRRVSRDNHLSRCSCRGTPYISKDIRWGAICRVEIQQGTLGLQHFNLLKKVGRGSIARVYLAELIGTNCLFAIKLMDNEFLLRRKMIKRAQTEKEILGMLDHPFLPTLYCQFTSDNLSCLVMEYCPGGDLHVLRERQPGKCFTEQAARFYVAQVLLALEYLHMLGVVYRDLKPENIMVQEDGHVMLLDFDLSLRCGVNPPSLLVPSSSVTGTTRRLFGSCVSCFTSRRLTAAPSKLKLKSRNKMKSETADQPRSLLMTEPITVRSNSFVGTHEYIAPEMIKGEGYGSSVDWWTFGILLYELLYGKTPFKSADNEGTLVNVKGQCVQFPDSPLVSLQARDLIMALLVKDPENRLGSKRGAADIKQHPFFEGLNWALIRCAGTRAT